MLEKKRRENENLTALKSQMKDMSAAFEVLKNTRIENKRKMEKKFEDTYDEIRENKEFTIASMNHVHDVVNQFQQKFQDELQKLGDDLKRQIDEEGDIFRKQWSDYHARMDECERRINQEREDRIKYHDDHLNPIRAQLKGIEDGLVKEKKLRITQEKKVIQEIKDESNNMQNDIKKEHEMRQQRMQDLDDQLTQDTDLTNKFLNNFESNATQAANTFLTDLESELDNRFKHQDSMLADMSTLVSKFQATLKVLGKDG